jgi:spore coat polysaccharide biosynthesis protein SpsF (cytidylyltransferase family)
MTKKQILEGGLKVWHVDYFLEKSLGKCECGCGSGIEVIHTNNKYKTRKEALEAVKRERPGIIAKFGKNRFTVKFLENWK